jgi:hypothetical protein
MSTGTILQQYDILKQIFNMILFVFNVSCTNLILDPNSGKQKNLQKEKILKSLVSERLAVSTFVSPSCKSMK